MVCQKKKKEELGREKAKLALYDRKHSNLLLIRTGSSSSSTPDREEGSSPLPWQQVSQKHENLSVNIDKLCTHYSEFKLNLQMYQQQRPLVLFSPSRWR